MADKVVLIGESFSIIQTIIKKQIETHFKILVAQNGEEVLKIIEENNLDVILLNPNILMQDGTDCIKIIRNLSAPNKANTPIIAITGNAYQYGIKQFKEMGFDNYIEKPIKFDLLIDLIKEITYSD